MTDCLPVVGLCVISLSRFPLLVKKTDNVLFPRTVPETTRTQE